MPSSITLHHISFSWPDGDAVLDDISGSFSTGRTGLVGDNGTGKTTLLRLISGELNPISGSILLAGDVSYLPQTVQISEGTVADLLGVQSTLGALAAIEAGSLDPRDYEIVGDDWDIRTKAEEMLAGLSLPGLRRCDLNRPVRTLSGGEAMAVAVAGIRLRRAGITLLDEPTNNMDYRTRAALIDMVESWPETLVVVSHDADLLEHVDSIAELRQGALSVFGGAFSAWKEAIEVEVKAVLQAERAAEQEVRTAKRQRVAAMERTARKLGRGKEKAIREGVPKLVRDAMKDQAESGAGRVKTEAASRVREAEEALNEAALRVRDDKRIHIDLPDPSVAHGKKILELTSTDGTSFIMAGPERVALVGANGSGKTTLIEQMLGSDVASPSGVVGRLLTDRVGYLPQSGDLSDESMSALDVIATVAPAATPGQVRNRLARMLIRGDSVFLPVRTLSGGERFRVSLAKLLFAEPPAQLLILDEPTNSLDLTSIGQLVEALGRYKGAILVVSHNPQFLLDLGIDVSVELVDAGMRVNHAVAAVKESIGERGRQHSGDNDLE